jgi:hypothetical protein
MVVSSRPGQAGKTSVPRRWRHLQRGFAVLLAGVLAACAARAPFVEGMAPRHPLDEASVKRLVGVWQQQLAHYIAREGAGDPAVLSQTGALRSRHVLRPAQVAFTALDVEATTPDRDGFDVQGVLIGAYAEADRNWWVFMVGIVARRGYRPASIEDVRVVAFTSLDGSQYGDLAWKMSAPAPRSVDRYRDSVPGSTAVRFPGALDRFEMSGSTAGLLVREARSGADWSLGPDAPASHARLEEDLARKPGRS